MARGIEGNEISTPKPPSLKKVSSSQSSNKNQKSILGFFSRRDPATSLQTPAPSSSPAPASSPPILELKENGLPSPVTPVFRSKADIANKEELNGHDSSTPSRKSRKHVNYVESGDEEEDADDDVFKPLSLNTTGRASKRRKIALDSDDEFEVDGDPTGSLSNSDEESLPAISTAQKWHHNSDYNPIASSRRPITSQNKNKKQKAHMTEPDQRYEWLANILDADRNPPSHPDYDPRTIYIPPLAWTKFSPFEKQYWEIKQNFWDTIVFFKKGKFYELYENDATVGNQLFDLKLTDRVNMRMVGVPEASLDLWANQFVAKGYKIARVDQMESALGKEMRERDDGASNKAKKEEKVIRRELAAVLTSGTLVDGGMLQNDMSTFCVAIKEIDQDNLPVFGLAFVDTATAQFHLAEIHDDADMTKFETFVAQIRPGELLLEKACLSVKALRILKNNTPPTAIWNWLKPTKEFWPGDITAREIDASEYFTPEDQDDHGNWPRVLREAKDKELVMSAFGALLQYLRTLKIERDLVSLGNFSWYDPIRKASSLVLDGQSLINLEIFANSFDGGSEGTLFAMLNRCVTPFGKRMLRQWVCHPLADANRINARLDAVDSLSADSILTDRFTSSLSKLPDLERLISRIHAGRCKAQDFVRVLEGFEQIEYTMSLVGALGGGEGVVGQLISSMPDLAGALAQWKTAFDITKAKDTGILVPETGVEEDFDASTEDIEKCENDLQDLLKRARKELNSSAICFRDNGKEIYQLEVPIKIKNVPNRWDQMSATAKVKRYYSPELRNLVRSLQEARETHAKVVREVAGHFYARFSEDYPVWLAAVKIIAQLDCLISLSRVSQSLGAPSCRPVFVESDRSVVKFENLRHPTMITNVVDFIPNDISLGGENPNMNLLTGANAAGKSTVLRMTCVAVILAQIGCHLPCASATLTPVDRIMSRLGANDNIMAAQSTFFVELAETKKMLTEATPRSLVILDELGRGTSSVDGLAVAEAVLHQISTHVGCTGFFATHYHSLAHEFARHPEIAPKRMKIDVDDDARRVTFLFKLEDGIAEGSFGMHCASMCGIPRAVVERAEDAAEQWEHSGRVKEKIERTRGQGGIPMGFLSDIVALLKIDEPEEDAVSERALDVLVRAISAF